MDQLLVRLGIGDESRFAVLFVSGSYRDMKHCLVVIQTEARCAFSNRSDIFHRCVYFQRETTLFINIASMYDTRAVGMFTVCSHL